MTKIVIKELTPDAFRPYGTFRYLGSVDALGPPLDGGPVAAPISFHPDLAQLRLGILASSTASISACAVSWRDLEIDVTEVHKTTMEGVMPLNGDIYLHVGRPTNEAGPEDYGLEVFRVPALTFVALNENVKHHAPHAVNEGEVVITLIILPPCAYINDCEPEPLMEPVSFAAG